MLTNTTAYGTVTGRLRRPPQPYPSSSRCGCYACGNATDAVRRALVRRAAARLDVVAPDWRSRVDPTTLDMNSCDRCVLGQVFGSYRVGLSALYGDARKGVADPGSIVFTGWVPVELWLEELIRDVPVSAGRVTELVGATR